MSCLPAQNVDWLSARLLDRAGEKGPIVLMYHGVHAAGERPPTAWSLSLSDFCAHLDLLQWAGWSTAPASALTSPHAIAPRTVVVTFDDGYADNFPAYQALSSRGMIATWFIVSDTVGERANWDDPDFAGAPMLSAGQLREMCQAGMGIGSHGRSHSRLTQLDEATLRSELRGSRERLEGIVGARIDTLAYPNGQYNEQVLEMASACGYALGFSCHAGHALSNFDPMRIKRIAIYREDDASSFARKLAFAVNRADWLDVGKYLARRVRTRIQRRAG